MRTFAILLLVGFVAAAPASEEQTEEKTIVVTEKFFPKEWEVYKSEHDIVSILLPLNSINFDGDSTESESEENANNVALFFVEADITPDGKRVDQGLYAMRKNVAKKILDNGRDMAASADDSKLVFLGASDGLYVYKTDEKVTEKYGSINDDIIGVAKEKTGEVIYILTANKEVYNVTENGNKKQKLEEIVNAQQIILDMSNNIYYYGDDKQVNVRTSESVKKITGLPENPSSITLLKPPYLMEEGIPCVVDNKTYILYPNGTSEVYGVEFTPNNIPTAFSMEAALLHYHAHDKKIYEYNLVKIITDKEHAENGDINAALSDKNEEIQSYSSNKRTII